MAKRRTTRTKTAHLRRVHVLDFQGVGSVCLYHVCAGIALITRPSNRAEKGKMSPSKKFVTKPCHCVAGHARQQCPINGLFQYVGECGLPYFVRLAETLFIKVWRA